MPSTIANKWKYVMSVGAHDFENDSFKILLMATGFTFNKDSHHAFADISASELATGFGYTQDTKVLPGVTVTEDDGDDRAEVTWTAVSWTAAGGSIGPTPGAIVYDDTIVAAGDVPADPIVGYIDFGGEQTQVDGGIFTLSGIGFNAS